MYYREDYNVTVKTRTVVKVTAAICLTIFGCRVAARVATPYLEDLTDKITKITENLKAKSDAHLIDDARQ